MAGDIALSVVAPAFDEAPNLPELAARTLATFDDAGLRGELVVVDDGSADDTRAVLRDLSAREPARIVPCFHRQNRGLSAAWATGLAAARGTHVCLIDSDLQYRPEDVARLYRLATEPGVDVAQGARSLHGRSLDARLCLSRGFNWLLNRSFGMTLRDNKSGFVCARREVLAAMLEHREPYRYFQSFLLVAAHTKGYRYAELEVPFLPRRRGRSFLSGHTTSAVVDSLLDVRRARREYGRRAERPASTQSGTLPPAVASPPATPERPARSLRYRAYLLAFDRTHWTITRDAERVLEALERSERFTRAELDALADEKLRRLVRHAYTHARHYREALRERGLTPDDIRGRADLHKLPLLAKDTVREQRDTLVARDWLGEALELGTSGSTGMPLSFFCDRGQLEFRWAATVRGQEMTGYRWGERSLRLWHQTIGMTRSQALRERADAWLANRAHVPVFELDQHNLARVLQKIERERPVLIDGYAEALDFLAQASAEVRPLAFHPRAVMSSAQALPDAKRVAIERAFGCPVFDKYGSREFSGIAYECEAHRGHHVTNEGYIVELLVDGRPAEPGEHGEVVVTDLNNLVMPFIRYRLGDLAEALADEPCACGRAHPRLGAIQGRVMSIIQGTGGRYVPGTFFAHCLKEHAGAIRHFQVEQHEPGALKLRIVKGERFSVERLERICAEFRRYLGADLEIEVSVVGALRGVPSGKRVESVSTVPVDWQAAASGPSRPRVRAWP